MTFEQSLVPWRITIRTLAEWCAYQVEHHPKSAAQCEAVLRAIVHRPEHFTTSDTGGSSCS